MIGKLLTEVGKRYRTKLTPSLMELDLHILLMWNKKVKVKVQS